MNGDVVDLYATLDQEFFDVSIRESVAEVPADSEHDHLGWESETGERGTILWEWQVPAMIISTPLPGDEPIAQRNSPDCLRVLLVVRFVHERGGS